MKKMTLATLVLLMSTSAFAIKYTGKIAKTIAEDGEGVKVIMQITETIPVVLYSSRSSAQHAVVMERIEQAKTENKAVTVEADNGAMAEIIKVYGN